MHSFHHSRGRILFEVFCALVIAGSCAAAWMQTGASALLPAAGVSLLYGFVHLFDLRGRSLAVVAEQPEIDGVTDRQDDVPVAVAPVEPEPVASYEPVTVAFVEEVEVAEPAAQKAGRGRRTKAPRKGSTRRAVAPEEAMVTEVEALEEVQAIEPAPVEAEIAEPAAPEEAEIVDFAPHEETAHPPIAPLFEPEPFARHQRAVFGRKAG